MENPELKSIIDEGIQTTKQAIEQVAQSVSDKPVKTKKPISKPISVTGESIHIDGEKVELKEKAVSVNIHGMRVDNVGNLDEIRFSDAKFGPITVSNCPIHFSNCTVYVINPNEVKVSKSQDESDQGRSDMVEISVAATGKVGEDLDKMVATGNGEKADLAAYRIRISEASNEKELDEIVKEIKNDMDTGRIDRGEDRAKLIEFWKDKASRLEEERESAEFYSRFNELKRELADPQTYKFYHQLWARWSTWEQELYSDYRQALLERLKNRKNSTLIVLEWDAAVSEYKNEVIRKEYSEQLKREKAGEATDRATKQEVRDYLEMKRLKKEKEV